MLVPIVYNIVMIVLLICNLMDYKNLNISLLVFLISGIICYFENLLDVFSKCILYYYSKSY